VLTCHIILEIHVQSVSVASQHIFSIESVPYVDSDRDPTANLYITDRDYRSIRCWLIDGIVHGHRVSESVRIL
jgi:hypothetical protein